MNKMQNERAWESSMKQSSSLMAEYDWAALYI